MFTTTSPLRRFGATLALAGFTALGSVALAPAASAALGSVTLAPAVSAVLQDGPTSVVAPVVGDGPDAFVILERGVKPIFFCDADEPNKRKNTCEAAPVDGPRF